MDELRYAELSDHAKTLADIIVPPGTKDSLKPDLLVGLLLPGYVKVLKERMWENLR